MSYTLTLSEAESEVLTHVSHEGWVMCEADGSMMIGPWLSRRFSRTELDAMEVRGLIKLDGAMWGLGESGEDAVDAMLEDSEDF